MNQISLFLCLLCLFRVSSAQTTTAATTTESAILLFKSDDLILINPVESTTLFMALLVCGAVFELLFVALRKRPEKFFHTVFESIIEESMLVGILTMILIFISSAGALDGNWNVMINNAVMVLLYMVVAFALLAVITIFWSLRAMKMEKKFEKSRMDVDPLLSPTEQLMKECKAFFKETLKLHKLTDASFEDVLFMDYIQERSAATIANIYDLSWKSWGVLGLFVVGNVIRTRSVVSDDTSKSDSVVLNIATFIAIMGAFPVALFLISHFIIRLRLVSLVKKQKPTDINIDTRHVLFFSSVDVTAAVFSVIILLLEWYLSMFFFNMANMAFEEFGAVAIVVVIAAILPPMVFLYFLPWTVMNITILGSLGKNLDVDLTRRLNDAVASGIDFTLLATHHDEPSPSMSSKANGKVPVKHQAIGKHSVIDPLFTGKKFSSDRTHSKSIRGTALNIDDEWETEMSINLRGSDSESTNTEEPREKSESSADDSGTSDSDEPLTTAIMDKNYLNDRESVHYTSRSARKSALDEEMKRKTERWTNNRNWDPLRPMYLPDWRHNPILAREEEIKESRMAIEAEKDRISRGLHFEL